MLLFLKSLVAVAIATSLFGRVSFRMCGGVERCRRARVCDGDLHRLPNPPPPSPQPASLHVKELHKISESNKYTDD